MLILSAVITPEAVMEEGRGMSKEHTYSTDSGCLLMLAAAVRLQVQQHLPAAMQAHPLRSTYCAHNVPVPQNCCLGAGASAHAGSDEDRGGRKYVDVQAVQEQHPQQEPQELACKHMPQCWHAGGHMQGVAARRSCQEGNA